MRKTLYAPAPGGAGKTYQIVARTSKPAKEGRLFLLIQPSKKLIDNTAEKCGFDSRTPLVKVFHQDTVGKHIARQLADYLACPEERPQLVLTTRQVLPPPPHSTIRSEWYLVICDATQAERAAARQRPIRCRPTIAVVHPTKQWTKRTGMTLASGPRGPPNASSNVHGRACTSLKLVHMRRTIALDSKSFASMTHQRTGRGPRIKKSNLCLIATKVGL